MLHQQQNVMSAVARIMAEKRDSNRVKSVFSASIHSGGAFLTHCVINDVSSTGMKLKLMESIELPEVFEVKTPAMEGTVEVRHIWANKNVHGVRFIMLDGQNLAEKAG